MVLSATVPLESTHQFSKLFTDYINQKKELEPFYGNSPSISGFKSQLGEKSFSKESRNILKKVFLNQYEGFKADDKVKANINLIEDTKTFTVTTGHQLCLFTGPLYFIYKIATTITLAQQLKAAFPANNFVPVYWMASEDHDFEEINHFYLFNKKYEWKSDQKGPVGLFDNKELASLIDTLPEPLPLFKEAYLNHKCLADATRFLVDQLFGTYGLLILDGNDALLKASFKEEIKIELSNKDVFNNIQKSNTELDKLGYPSQVHPREINLFYIEKGLRERIVFEDGLYKILNTDLTFSHNAIIDLVDKHPEKFSPNVVLRPLYQEIVLPNLAYIGGPGEMAYWLQLKAMFNGKGIAYPILLPRNFGLIYTNTQKNKLDKLGFDIAALFNNEVELKRQYLEKKKIVAWDDSRFSQKIAEVFKEIKKAASELDKSLEGFVDAQQNESEKILQTIDKKIRKTAEQKEAEGIGQLMNLKNKLFPEGGLQERKDNFLNFFINDPSFVDELINLFDPLKFVFYLIEHTT